MTDIRIIADEFRDGIEGYDSNLYMVLKDGPIKSIADMKGKIFATNGIGGGQDIFARVMFETRPRISARLYDNRDDLSDNEGDAS